MFVSSKEYRYCFEAAKVLNFSVLLMIFARFFFIHGLIVFFQQL